MFKYPKNLKFISWAALLLLIALLTIFIYKHNGAVYTANLDARPLNAGICGAVNSLEPAAVIEHQERLIASAIYEGLLRYDTQSDEIKPGLAKKWKYSADAKTLTLHLRKDIKFHNGKKIDAAAVKAAWEKSFSDSKESNVSMFLPIQGSNAALDGYKQEITGIQAVNNSTLQINFDQPNAAFIYMLTSPVFWVYDSSQEDVLTAGSGPYCLKQNQPGERILLVKNENYYRGTPRLSALNFVIYDDELKALVDYKAGKLDYLDSIPFNQIKEIKEQPEYKRLYINRPLLNTYFLTFHLNKKPFDDGYQLRRALNYAIDREAINNIVLGGAYAPIQGVVPSGLENYKSDMNGYSYDPEKARQLLEDAGYLVGDQHIPLTVSYYDDKGHQALLETVAEQLERIGVSLELTPLDWDYYKKQLGKMQIACGQLSWYADYPDPDNYLYSMFHSSQIGVSNFSAYNNPQVDKLLDLSRRQTDRDKRMDYLHQAEEIIVDDAPCLWLFQKWAHKLIGKDVVSLTVDSMEMIDWYQVELHKPDLNEEQGTSKESGNKV